MLTRRAFVSGLVAASIIRPRLVSAHQGVVLPFNPNEIAEIIVDGMRYRDWESVLVHLAEGESDNKFKFTCSEGIPFAKDWAAIRIRPGDRCTIILAGQLAITGVVETRQVSYAAEQHGIQISGKSLTGAMVDGAVMHPTMEFKNKPLTPIAQEIAKPFGIQFKPVGPKPISQKPFDRVNIPPGQPAWHAIETLARQRGVTLGTDTSGNLTGRVAWDPGGGSLIESVNILEGHETMTLMAGAGPNYGYSQETANDQKWGPKVAHDANSQSNNGMLKAIGSKGTYGPNVVLAEHPGDKQDTQMRADGESDRRGQEQLEVTIVVQGWLRSGGGGLWKPGSKVHVRSPMLIVDEDLKLMTVDFTQDRRSGTRTTLSLTRETGGTGVNYGSGAQSQSQSSSASAASTDTSGGSGPGIGPG